MALDYLPTPNWAVVYGEVPSASKWSQLGTNDNALATAAGIDDLAILTRHINDKAATTRKLKPTYFKLVGDNGSASTRQTFNSNTPTVAQGTQFSYTTGPTTEVLILDSVLLITETADSNAAFFVNGAKVSNVYYKSDKTYTSVYPSAIFEAAANTTYTIDVRVWGSQPVTIANAIQDRTASNNFGPETHLLAFGR